MVPAVPMMVGRSQYIEQARLEIFRGICCYKNSRSFRRKRRFADRSPWQRSCRIPDQQRDARQVPRHRADACDFDAVRNVACRVSSALVYMYFETESAGRGPRIAL